MGLLCAPHSWFNPLKLLLRAKKKFTLLKKSLHGLHYFAPRCVFWHIQHFRIQHMLARDPILTSALYFLSRIYSRQLAEVSRMYFGYHDAWTCFKNNLIVFWLNVFYLKFQVDRFCLYLNISKFYLNFVQIFSKFI